MARRGVELDPRCVMCNRHDEDGAHLFFKCKYVKYIWTTLGLDHQRSILSAMLTPEDVVKYILNLKEDLQLCIVTLLWLWWQERNRVREGEKRRSVDVLSFLCKQLVSEYATLCKTPHVSTGGRSVS